MKSTILLLCIFLMVTFTGCSSSQQEKQQETQEPTEAATTETSDPNETYERASQIFEEKVIPVYKKQPKYADRKLKWQEDGMIYLDEQLCYIIYCYAKGKGKETDHVDTFAVNPVKEKIYWYDTYHTIDEEYHLWDGTYPY